MASSSLELPPSLETFTETYNTYFAQLSIDEKEEFPKSRSVADFIDEIKTLSNRSSTKNEKAVRGALEKVHKFAELLQPYFEPVGIIIQSHLEFAGVVWRCIRGALLVISLLRNIGAALMVSACRQLRDVLQ